MTRKQRGYLAIAIACVAGLTISSDDLLGITLRFAQLGVLGWALFKFINTDY